MRCVALAIGCLLGGTAAGLAASCPGNPNAIGTSRTIAVDPVALPRIGSMQYPTSLPLNDHEVAITFDDGPLPPFTNRILDTLASECVKVTYFLIGRQANAYPDLVRRIYNAGHAIGTHSQNHPLTFNQMALPRLESEIGAGITSVQTAVGDPRAVAPFFRIPGLLRNAQVEDYLASQSIAVWSADEVADDWYRHVTPQQIVRKAISRIEAKGNRGVLLLHDIHPATAMALPMLLKELKVKGYRIVQAVPNGDRPKSVPENPAPAVADSGAWPRVVNTSITAPTNTERTEVREIRTRLKVTERKFKTSRHGERFVRNRHNRAIAASIAIKRHKTKTAATGWNRSIR